MLIWYSIQSYTIIIVISLFFLLLLFLLLNRYAEVHTTSSSLQTINFVLFV